MVLKDLLRRRERKCRPPSERKLRQKGWQAGGRMPECLSTEPHEHLHELREAEAQQVDQAKQNCEETCGPLAQTAAEHQQEKQGAEQRAQTADRKARDAREERDALPRPRFGPVVKVEIFLLLTFGLTLIDTILTRVGLTHLLLPPTAIQFLTFGFGAIIVFGGDLLGILTGKLVDESGPGNSLRTESVLRTGLFVVAGFLLALLVAFNLWRYHDFDKTAAVPPAVASITLFFVQLLVVAIAWWLGLVFHESAEHRKLDQEAEHHERDGKAERKQATTHAAQNAAAERGIVAAIDTRDRRIDVAHHVYPQRAWVWVGSAADRRPDLRDTLHRQHAALWPNDRPRRPIIARTQPPLELTPPDRQEES